jgi:hypothetical protein
VGQLQLHSSLSWFKYLGIKKTNVMLNNLPDENYNKPDGHK